MALGALFVGLFLLFQHVVGSTYLFFLRPGDVTTLQCNVPTGAGNKVTLCNSSDPGSEMGKIKCKNEKPCYENIGPQGKKGHSEPECTKCKLNDHETESLTFAVKTINSMVFTCMAQDSTEGGALECPSWLTLSQPGCENHDLFFVITQDAQVTSVMSSRKSSDTPTSTSGISSVTGSITPTNIQNPAITVNVAIVCLIVLICIVGIVCIIGVVCRRKRQSVKGKGSSAPGPRAGDVQLTQVAECFPYSVVPRKDQSDDNEPVAYSVTRVPTPSSQPRPGEGMESTGPNIDSTEHVYCLIEESMVKGDDGKTEIQAVKCSDRTDHVPQVETSLAIELKPDGQSQPKEDSKEDPVALSNEQTYSLIGCPGTGSPGDTETRSWLEEDDPQPGPLEMEENPIYAKIEEA
uniref:uncharacterized protein isoform X5 n=1 Tax=Pristiophorus japonicus TaxID=55135 RepID=UPI00398EC3CE